MFLNVIYKYRSTTENHQIHPRLFNLDYLMCNYYFVLRFLFLLLCQTFVNFEIKYIFILCSIRM